MKYPTLNVQNTSRQMVDTFRGYNHNLRIGDGEFYDMKNLTSDSYPVLSPRGARGVYAVPENPQGMIGKDSLCYVDGSEFVMDGYPENAISSWPSWVSMMFCLTIASSFDSHAIFSSLV